MRIGFDHYTIAHCEFTPEQTLEFAREHSLEGVQFLEPSTIDPGLDHDRLRAFRREADELGLYLEVGLPSPNPVRRARELGREVSAVEHARDLERQLEAVAALGCRHARAYIGDRHDRFRTDVPWREQLAATRDTLKQLDSSLRALGIRIALETHADVTTEELLRLIADVGEDALGVTLDTGNLVMRLDDPIRAVERLAPLVLSTHIKDAVLAFTTRGLCWQARPIGSGIMPIPDMLALLHKVSPSLNLSIELHARTYDLPIFESSWLAFFPDLQARDLSAVVRLTAACERQFAQGNLERPETIESIPWSERAFQWLARSVGYLRPVVDLLDTL